MRNFLLGFLLGAGLMYAAIMFHVVRANDGFHFVHKLEAGFTDIYVDIREFTVVDWNEHRSLAAALVRAEKADLFGDSTVDASIDEFKQGMHKAVESLTSEE